MEPPNKPRNWSYWVYDVSTSKTTWITKEHPDILHFNYTYSTNKYKLLLLDICGVTAQNTTIQVGIALMSGEKKEDFMEVFQDLDTIFKQ